MIAGPEDNGYYEISYWPEGWSDERTKADLERGYYRIVPDPFDPIDASGTEARQRQDREDGPDPKGDGPAPKEDAHD